MIYLCLTACNWFCLFCQQFSGQLYRKSVVLQIQIPEFCWVTSIQTIWVHVFHHLLTLEYLLFNWKTLILLTRETRSSSWSAKRVTNVFTLSPVNIFNRFSMWSQIRCFHVSLLCDSLSYFHSLSYFTGPTYMCNSLVDTKTHWFTFWCQCYKAANLQRLQLNTHCWR